MTHFYLNSLAKRLGCAVCEPRLDDIAEGQLLFEQPAEKNLGCAALCWLNITRGKKFKDVSFSMYETNLIK